MRRIDRKSLAALLLVITRIIKADSRVDAVELKALQQLEQHYGFDRKLMPEAARMTLAEAVERLAGLDEALRQEILASLDALARSDRLMERHEALLLLTLRYCLAADQGMMGQTQVITGNRSRHSSDLGTYVIYCESEASHPGLHAAIDSQWELANLMMQQHGLQLMVTEQLVSDLCRQEPAIITKLIEYMAPELNDEQVGQLYRRMQQMDTATFVQRVLIRQLGYEALRNSGPALLVSLGQADMLRIALAHDGSDLMSKLRAFTADYRNLASPSTEAMRIIDHASQPGHFKFYGYFHDLLGLLAESEPRESRMVMWPGKSEIDFPQIGRTLKLNQQEASIYTLIAYYTYCEGGKGLPLCYTPAQRQIEALYRTVYCRKKLVETQEVAYPDNLAPIRAKIERKMREQLVGLDNLEDFIPHNQDRAGFYCITAPAHMVCIRPDYRQPEQPISDFRWT